MKRNATPEQKVAAQARRDKFRAMCKTIAAMTQEQRTALTSGLIVTVTGHTLSGHNMMMVAFQNPRATVVGGFRQWLAAGRCVRKGEHGLMIWVPIGKSRTAEEVQDVADGTEKTGFIMGTVFDVTQTEEIQKEGAV